MLDIEALVKEAYGSSKLKIEAKRKDMKETEVGAYAEVGERYIGTT